MKELKNLMMTRSSKSSVGILWVTAVLCLFINLQAQASPNTRIRLSQTNTANGIAPGTWTSVEIVYDAGDDRIGEFYFLIEYDYSAVKLASVEEGNIYNKRGWEFFDFRFYPNGNCVGGCPSGKVRVMGLADQNNGKPGGRPTLKTGDTFATLVFYVAAERSFGCGFSPVRFVWLDCQDNSMVSANSEVTYISAHVFDFKGSDTGAIDLDFRKTLSGQNASFPTITGAPSECDTEYNHESFALQRQIEFYNGGVLVSCPDEIDDRGDLDLNGIPYEIADLEILLGYFLSGVSDSIPLSVSDVVYFIRHIFDEAVPLIELTHDEDTVTFKQSNGAVFSDLILGAAFFVFEGNPDVQLLDSAMEMLIGSSDGRKRVLIIDIGSDELAPGKILLTEGKLLSAQASDFIGSRVVVEFDFATDVVEEDILLPDEFRLSQNYPNPFNPTTTIEFSVPVRASLELIVYNTLGRKVRSLVSGMYSAGNYSVSWDGTDDNGKQVTSGVYYYRLKAGEVVQSRKMVLLK